MRKPTKVTKNSITAESASIRRAKSIERLASRPPVVWPNPAGIHVNNRLTCTAAVPTDAAERDDDAEADGGFRGRDRDHEHGEHLSGEVPELAGERDEVEVGGVEDQLDAHQDGDEVPPHRHADDAEREQREREHEDVRG